MKKSVIKVRFISFCLILLAFVLLGNKQVNAASGLGDTVKDQNFWGVITKLPDHQGPGEVAIKGLTNQGAQNPVVLDSLNIPSEITAWGNRYLVTSIAAEAFSGVAFWLSYHSKHC